MKEQEPDYSKISSGRFGLDRGPGEDDRRMVGEDYSIGGGVTMRHPFDHGFSGKGPKGREPSDERIREDACQMLYRSYEVDASDIDVSVKDGCVILKGTVSGRNMKRDAELCVENLAGVQDVQNELRVGKSSENPRPEFR